MSRNKRPTKTTTRDSRGNEVRRSYTGPNTPAKVRPTTPVVEPDTKPSQPEVKPDQKPEVKPESPKSEN